VIGKKLLFSKILYYTRLITFFKLNATNCLVVCNYHRLYKGKLDTSFDDGVFAHSVNDFENHLIWLKNNTKVLCEHELIELVKNGNDFSSICSLITFDDGYIDNYTLAYPVLKRLEIPAIFYIPTSQINSRQLGWWDIIAYLIKKTPKHSISFDGEPISLANGDTAIRFFQQKMKTKQYEENADLLSKLSEACEVPLPDIATQSKELMTWDQIREVASHGIAIGSHTHSHRVLSTIPISEQQEEMIISKSIIENEIGKIIKSIAYPVGNYQHFTSETMKLASECGYDAAFSFNTGINYAHNLNAFDIKRIEPSKNIELLAATAVLPHIFA